MALLDGFQGFEGIDSPANRLIQGQIVKFTNEATGVTRDGEELSGTLELIALNVIRVVQKWEEGQPIETRVLQPGEKFPNFEELNATVPQSEWRQGPRGAAAILAIGRGRQAAPLHRPRDAGLDRERSPVRALRRQAQAVGYRRPAARGGRGAARARGALVEIPYVSGVITTPTLRSD